ALSWRDALESPLELRDRGVLEEIAGDARAQGLSDVSLTGVHREDHDLRPRRDGGDPRGDLQSGQPRHGDVEEDDIGSVLLDELERFAAVSGLPDDGRAGKRLQERADASPNELVVVREDDGERDHLKPSLTRRASHEVSSL